MRDYQQVIEERYDRENLSGAWAVSNVYAPLNPVGNYGVYKITQVLRRFIRTLLRRQGRTTTEGMTFLDCGCGVGRNSRLLADLLGDSSQVYGYEYSRNRLDKCVAMNPAIHYKFGNICHGGGGLLPSLTV